MSAKLFHTEKFSRRWPERTWHRLLYGSSTPIVRHAQLQAMCNSMLN